MTHSHSLDRHRCGAPSSVRSGARDPGAPAEVERRMFERLDYIAAAASRVDSGCGVGHA